MHSQIPDEESAVFECCCGQRQYDPRASQGKCCLGNQFLGFPFEEELAKRESALLEVHHGPLIPGLLLDLLLHSFPSLPSFFLRWEC